MRPPSPPPPRRLDDLVPPPQALVPFFPGNLPQAVSRLSAFGGLGPPYEASTIATNNPIHPRKFRGWASPKWQPSCQLKIVSFPRPIRLRGAHRPAPMPPRPRSPICVGNPWTLFLATGRGNHRFPPRLFFGPRIEKASRSEIKPPFVSGCRGPIAPKAVPGESRFPVPRPDIEKGGKKCHHWSRGFCAAPSARGYYGRSQFGPVLNP